MLNKTERLQLTDELLEMIAAAKLIESITEEEEDDDTSDDHEGGFEDHTISDLLHGLISESIHTRRYLNERREIAKSTSTLVLLLETWKIERPSFSVRTSVSLHDLDSFENF
jgi:hypothetical protein